MLLLLEFPHPKLGIPWTSLDVGLREQRLVPEVDCVVSPKCASDEAFGVEEIVGTFLEVLKSQRIHVVYQVRSNDRSFPVA